MSKQVGEILRNARLYEGLSQQELADDLGLSQQVISRMEKGEHDPRLLTLVKMQSALGGDVIADVILQVEREVGL